MTTLRLLRRPWLTLLAAVARTTAKSPADPFIDRDRYIDGEQRFRAELARQERER